MSGVAWACGGLSAAVIMERCRLGETRTVEPSLFFGVGETVAGLSGRARGRYGTRYGRKALTESALIRLTDVHSSAIALHQQQHKDVQGNQVDDEHVASPR